jgi:hypothetical protein
MEDREFTPVHRLGSREASRQAIRMIVLARKGHRRQAAEARDLALGGVRLRTLNPLRVGSVYWLKIGSLEALEVTVIWVDRFNAGCQFTKPIHPAVFEALIAALDKD